MPARRMWSRKIRFCLSSALLLIGPALPAAAEPIRMSGQEIYALFKGNTVHGEWAGTEYWSYFGTDGWTTYKTKGAELQTGRWSTNQTQYCSIWGEARQACYDILKDGWTLIWVTRDGNHYTSTLLQGNQTPPN
jgi:hypothetical protein